MLCQKNANNITYRGSIECKSLSQVSDSIVVLIFIATSGIHIDTERSQLSRACAGSNSNTVTESAAIYLGGETTNLRVKKMEIKYMRLSELVHDNSELVK